VGSDTLYPPYVWSRPACLPRQSIMSVDSVTIPAAYVQHLGSKVGYRCFQAVLCGIVLLFVYGFSWASWRETYLIIIWGIAACFGVTAYRMASMQVGERSLLLAMFALSGFITYSFGAYLMVYCGAYRLYSLVHGFEWLRLCAGIFWLVLGFQIVNALWLLSEVLERLRSGEFKAET